MVVGLLDSGQVIIKGYAVETNCAVAHSVWNHPCAAGNSLRAASRADGADGALYSTVQNLYLWDQSLYTEQLLPHAQLDQMFAPHTDPVLGGLAYGYGWFVGKYQGQLIAEHAGRDPGARTIIARYPDDQVAIIMLSNQRSSDVRQIMLDLSNKIFDDK